MRLYNVFFLLGFCFINQSVLVLASDLIESGRLIYEEGIGRDSREIRATAHGSVLLKGAAIACSGCHGNDGRGGGEAFVQAPDIRWLSLSKEYPARRIGAAETSYDQSSFAKVLRAGIAANGRKLDPAMPRFDLADDEINSLIAYLGTIDKLENSEQAHLVILGLLPKPGRNTLADALDSKIKNCPAEKTGGPIAAIDMLYFDTPKDAIIKLNKRLSENPDALVLAPFLPGWEHQYANAIQYSNASTVLPFSLLNPPDESYWIFPFPGLEAQILALLKYVKLKDYVQLRIHSEPKNPFSARLTAIAIKMATTYGMLAIEGSSERMHEHAKIATLWLKQVNPDQIDQNSLKDELMLVPIMFFKPNQANKNPLPQWRIAYPYNPKAGKSGKWRTPVDVWAGAACKILSLAGERSIDLNKLPEILKWEEDLFLYSRPNLDLLSDQVFIDIVE